MPSGPSFTPSDPDFEARVRASFARQGLMRTLGAELAVVRPGGYAAFTLMGPGDSVLAVEFKINLLEPAHGDALFARGQVLRSGRRLSVCRVDVFVARDGEEKPCAAMQQTVIRLAGRPDAPDTG
jgi:acyl-coenzyme A thioesterase PaaI-like protein